MQSQWPARPMLLFSGRTDTKRENNDQPYGLGLVGQYILAKTFIQFFSGSQNIQLSKGSGCLVENFLFQMREELEIPIETCNAHWIGGGTQTKRNKTGVVNDPLCQTHSPVSSDHYSHLKIVLFCSIFKIEDGRTFVKIMVTTGRVCGSASWIKSTFSARQKWGKYDFQDCFFSHLFYGGDSCMFWATKSLTLMPRDLVSFSSSISFATRVFLFMR